MPLHHPPDEDGAPRQGVEVTATVQHQSLVQCVFEPEVGHPGHSILVGSPGIDQSGLWAVVYQEFGITVVRDLPQPRFISWVRTEVLSQRITWGAPPSFQRARFSSCFKAGKTCRWSGELLYICMVPWLVRSANPGYCFQVAGWRKCRDHGQGAH